jgi:U3 small nucleolar RNA-associated protein 12
VASFNLDQEKKAFEKKKKITCLAGRTMVKAYLRYAQQDAFGVIASPNCNAVVHPDGSVFTGALEAVLRWSVRKGAIVQRLRVDAPSGPGADATAEVVRLELDAEARTLAVGHFDGRVRLWDLATGTERVALYGHRRAVTALRFDRTGFQLASGSADTDVVVWDVTAEVGLFRLHGHRDAVTDLVFLAGGRFLASCAKDGLLKLWDLPTQHCAHTAVGHAGEVWAMDASPDGTRLVSAGTDDAARLWRVHVDEAATSSTGSASLAAAGTLARRGKARAVSVRFDATGGFLAIASLDRAVDVFAVRSAAELRRATKRLAKRAGERAARKARKAESKRFVDEAAPDADADADGDDADEGEEAAAGEGDVTVEFVPHAHLRASHKLSSAAFAPDAGASAAAALGSARSGDGGGAAGGGGARPAAAALLVLGLRANSLAVYAVSPERAVASAAEPDSALATGAALVGVVEHGGHRSEIRSLTMSGDGRLVATVSDGEACVWAAESGQCLHALRCGYGLCCALVAASSHLVVGTKSGQLQLYSLAAAEVVQELDAHEGGAVWALAVLPGGLGLVSAGADKTMRTWALEALRADGGGSARVAALRLSPERVLRLTEDALAVTPTSDGKFLAVSLLDGTIKVLFADSLKFYLSLYGHKLPALALDVATDCAILASGSADKSIKLWGLDFGDCRKSLAGHSEAVTAVRFVRDTHYLFSASKDRTVRYWDADRFTQLLVLAGHRAEVWGLDVSRDGGLVATAGRDRGVRLWGRTDEQLFVEEEREAELEHMFDAALEGARDQDATLLTERAMVGSGGGADGGAEGGGAIESGAAARRSLETYKGTERLLEALSVLKGDDERNAEYDKAIEAWTKAGGARGRARRATQRRGRERDGREGVSGARAQP